MAPVSSVCCPTVASVSTARVGGSCPGFVSRKFVETKSGPMNSDLIDENICINIINLNGLRVSANVPAPA